jgi:hypothetical protein
MTKGCVDLAFMVMLGETFHQGFNVHLEFWLLQVSIFVISRPYSIHMMHRNVSLFLLYVVALTAGFAVTSLSMLKRHHAYPPCTISDATMFQLYIQQLFSTPHTLDTVLDTGCVSLGTESVFHLKLLPRIIKIKCLYSFIQQPLNDSLKS